MAKQNESKEITKGFDVDHQQSDDMLTIKVKYNIPPSIYDDDSVKRLMDRHAKFLSHSVELLDLRKKFGDTLDLTVVNEIMTVIEKLQVLVIEVNEA